ncbi:MAG: hypothetical protein KGL02_02740 [Acidobacteriota bacterium]|nr:hypothetical protein [Acidobacteriota bacterium]MDE3170246.1 hypothetical protein [Acidobacteriota bacterium]
MASPSTSTCRRVQCANPIPAALAAERLCLSHFLDEAFLRADHTLALCRDGCAINSGELEWLLADALTIVNNLEEPAAPNPDVRDRMLELLLILANLQEYVAHHSIHTERLA